MPKSEQIPEVERAASGQPDKEVADSSLLQGRLTRRSFLSGLGAAGIAPAITAAAYHATGVQVRELPTRIEDLLTSKVMV
jgi:hypothetical protein